MSPWALALVTAISFVPPAVEADGLRVGVAVKSHVYTWTVKNVSGPAITGFEVGQHNCYNEQAPRGWTAELDDGLIRAEADGTAGAIRPGRSVSFTAQVSSSGAVLGSVPATLHRADGTVVELEVWGPVRMPAGIFFVISGTIVVIGLFHALVIERRRA